MKKKHISRMDPETRSERQKYFKDLRNNQKEVFKDRFNKLIGDRSLSELSRLLDVDRGTIINWKHGRTLPGRQRLQEIGEIFNEPDFFQNFTLKQHELVNPQFQRTINDSKAKFGAFLNINESFIRFIRDNSRFSNAVSQIQSPSEHLINKTDPRAPRLDLPYQFTNESGERIFLDEYTIRILRVLQDDIEKSITEKLTEYTKIAQQEYRHNLFASFDKEYNGYFQERIRDIRKEQNEDPDKRYSSILDELDE